MKYYQVKMISPNDAIMTAWIEERGATIGFEVELLDDGQFWRVLEVYDHPLEEQILKTKQKNDRNCFASILK